MKTEKTEKDTNKNEYRWNKKINKFGNSIKRNDQATILLGKCISVFL